jgi:potassium-transporting ATPase potassium-binding subunit
VVGTLLLVSQGAMLVMMLGGLVNTYYSEAKATPGLAAAGVHATVSPGSTGGNLADKEQRFGIANSALWATTTTDASNGSVNGSHESDSGFGGVTPLANMMTGEVIFGGVGSGLYGMLMLVVLTVFLGGLMVGRTPEYLGKKIQAREVKLVAIGTLYMRWWC